MEKMKAIVINGTKDFQVASVEKPRPGFGEVVIQIEAAGICSGDRSMFFGTAPWGEITSPMILGHEYVGTVVELGENAGIETSLKIGDRCLAELQIPCGKCYYCLHGLRHLCTDEGGFLEGGWAEFMLIRRGAIVHKVPHSIPSLAAALIEPLSCSAHGVERASMNLKDIVVISGMGAIGLGMIAFARMKSPFKLIGLDINDKMLDIAKKLGADHVFNPKNGNVKDFILDQTDGIGADIYIEASGSSSSLSTGLDVLRKRGRLIVYGVYAKPATVDFNQVSEYKELEIIGGHLSPGTYPPVIQALQRNLINTDLFITDVYTFDEFDKAIYAKTTNPNSVKTLLVPNNAGKVNKK